MDETVPDTAYVNHAWSSEAWNPIITALYRNQIAAIHFGEYPVSFDSAEWDEVKEKNTPKNSINRLCKYNHEGRIVAVSYTGHPSLCSGRYVGTVGPVGTKNEQNNHEMALLVCRFGADIDPDDVILGTLSVPIEAAQSQIEPRLDNLTDEASDYVWSVIENEGLPEEQSDQYRILKGIQLYETDVDWVWNQDFPGLWAANKRGTLMGWDKGNQHLYAAYYSAVSEDNISRVDDVYDILGTDKSGVWALSEGQLEALCGEYLRRKNDNYVELISAGGALSDVDIFGGIEDKSGEVLAQVTFETDTSKVEEKLRRLLAYDSDTYTADIWFFGPKSQEQQLPEEIEDTPLSDVYLPIETVFEEFEGGLGPEYVDLLLTVDQTPGRPSV
jgi:hypothetical protein